MSNSLLKRLSVNPFQPFKLRLLFEIGQFGRTVKVGGFLVQIKVIFVPQIEEVVVDKPATTKMMTQQFLLAHHRVNSKFVGSKDRFHRT